MFDQLRWVVGESEGTIDYASLTTCRKTVVTLLVTTFLRMSRMFATDGRQVSQRVWCEAEKVEKLQGELLTWDAIAWFNGFSVSGKEPVEYGATSETYRPWSVRPLAEPLITASVHFSLEEQREARRADRAFARMVREWKANHANVEVCE